MKPFFLACCIAAASMILATPAYAELGDYNALKTLLNLSMPPAADNKVTAEQGLQRVLAIPSRHLHRLHAVCTNCSISLFTASSDSIARS